MNVHAATREILAECDVAIKFPGLPLGFYGDWLRVAAGEAHHFTLLRAHLRAPCPRGVGRS